MQQEAPFGRRQFLGRDAAVSPRLPTLTTAGERRASGFPGDPGHTTQHLPQGLFPFHFLCDLMSPHGLKCHLDTMTPRYISLARPSPLSSKFEDTTSCLKLTYSEHLSMYRNQLLFFPPELLLSPHLSKWQLHP